MKWSDSKVRDWNEIEVGWIPRAVSCLRDRSDSGREGESALTGRRSDGRYGMMKKVEVIECRNIGEGMS